MRFIAGTILLLTLSVAIFAQNEIQKVDFKNFTYLPYCAGEKTRRVTVKNGEYSEEKDAGGFTDRFYFKVFDTAYGDLTGDGRPEAIVLTSCNTGGTGQFSEGFVYGLKAGKPVLLARILGGDRAFGGLRSAYIENGMAVIERNDEGPNGAACCPEFTITSKYKLAGTKLTEIGKPMKRELYPREPLRFAKGASSAEIKLDVAREDRKRVTLVAKAGQIMSVSVNTAKLSVRLLEDAMVTEGENAFTARLPKNGTYTIEISNYEDSNVEGMLKVTIE